MVAARRNVLIAVLALSGCRTLLGIDEGVVGTDAPPAKDSGVDASAGRYRKEMVIVSPIQENLEGFAVPILRGPDPDLVAHARVDGSDLQILDDGDRLPVEIVSYDGTTGALEAWVLLPELNSTNRLDLVYGAPTNAPPGLVWGQGVSGVWHFTPTPPSGPFPDSSANRNAATPVFPSAPPTVRQGIAGASLEFGPTTGIVDVGDPQNGSVDFAGSFSVSLWVRVMLSTSAYDRPLYKGGASTTDAGYSFELGSGVWNVLISDGATIVNAPLGADTDHVGSWVLLSAVVNRTTNTLQSYVNGEPSGTALIAALGPLTNNKSLSFSAASFPFVGMLDEVRLYSAVKPAEWFEAEHAFLTNNANWITVLSEQDGND